MAEQVKIDGDGAVVTVEATGYSVIVRGMPANAELSPREAARLGTLFSEAAEQCE